MLENCSEFPVFIFINLDPYSLIHEFLILYPRGVIVNSLDFDILVSKFEF